MKRIILITIALILFGSRSIYAQYQAVTDFCVKGATPATTSGLNSINTLQGVVPGGPAGCLVQVYLTGTTTPATIYSSSSGGTLNNPFRASLSGQWLFYASTSSCYDIMLSGGNPPNTYSTPITLTGRCAGANTPFSYICPVGSTVSTCLNQVQIPFTITGCTVTNPGGISTVVFTGSGFIAPAGTMIEPYGLTACADLNQLNMVVTISTATTLTAIGFSHANISTSADSGTAYTGGVNIQYASSATKYTSVASSPVYGPNISFTGAQEPTLTSDSSRLVGGTVIQGQLLVYGNGFSMSNAGIDTGPAYIAAGGVAGDSLVVQSPTLASSAPYVNGFNFANLYVLPNPSGSIHAARFEHAENGLLRNITQPNSGGHGVTIKGPNITLNGFTVTGNTTDGIIVACDGNTPLVTNVQTLNGIVDNSASGGTGIVYSTEGSNCVTSYVTTDGVTGKARDSFAYDVQNNDANPGLVNHIVIQNSAAILYGSHPGFGASGSQTSDAVTLNNDTYSNPNYVGLSSPLGFGQSITQGVVNGFTATCGSYASDLEGIWTVNGYVDNGNNPDGTTCTTTQPSVATTVSGTIVSLSGRLSNRGNAAATATGGSVVNVFPTTVQVTTDGVNTTWAVSSTGGKVDTFENKGATGSSSEDVAAKADTSDYSTFDVITPLITWKSGTATGTSHLVFGPIKSSVLVPVIDINDSAPASSIAILSTGQPYLYYFNTSHAGCIQSDTGGNLSNTGTTCQIPLGTPSSSSAACIQGAMMQDASYIYACTATNTWKRTALSSF